MDIIKRKPHKWETHSDPNINAVVEFYISEDELTTVILNYLKSKGISFSKIWFLETGDSPCCKPFVLVVAKEKDCFFTASKDDVYRFRLTAMVEEEDK